MIRGIGNMVYIHGILRWTVEFTRSVRSTSPSRSKQSLYIYIYINKKERETRGKKQQNILVQEEGRIFPLNKS